MNSFFAAPLRSLEEIGEVELEMTGAAAAAAAKDTKKTFNGTLLLGKRTHKHRNTLKGVFWASVQCSPVCPDVSCSNVELWAAATLTGQLLSVFLWHKCFLVFSHPFLVVFFPLALDEWLPITMCLPAPPLCLTCCHCTVWLDKDQDRLKCCWSGVCSSFFPLFLLFFADTNNHDHNRSRWTCCYGGREF